MPCFTSAGVPGASSTSDQPASAFPVLANFASADSSPDGPASVSAAAMQPASQEQPSSTASAPQLDKAPQKDIPLLQINPAQLSRSGSRTTASPRDLQDGAMPSQAPHKLSQSDSAPEPSTSDAQAAGALSGVAEPTGLGIAVSTRDAQQVVNEWAAAASSGGGGSAAVAGGGGGTAAVSGIKPQGSGTSDLLAAVNAVVGGLALRHTASLSGGAALATIAENPGAGSGAQTDASASMQQRPEGVAALAAPEMFLGMSAASFRRTRSNLRTGGSLTASNAAQLPGALSSSGAAGQLSRQVSQGMQQTAASHLLSGNAWLLDEPVMTRPSPGRHADLGAQCDQGAQIGPSTAVFALGNMMYAIC